MKQDAEDRDGHDDFPLPESEEWRRADMMKHLEALDGYLGPLQRYVAYERERVYAMSIIDSGYPTPYTDMVMRVETIVRSNFDSMMGRLNSASSSAASLDQAVEDHRRETGHGRAYSIERAAQLLADGPQSGKSYRYNMARLRQALAGEAI